MDFSGIIPVLTGVAAVGAATVCLLQRLRNRKLRPLSALENVDLTGKTAIVTGANTGIGFWTAQALAEHHAKVILACRSLKRGEEARRKIVDATGNKKVEVRVLDLMDFSSVRQFAEDFKKSETRLDILVNNAGVYVGPALFPRATQALPERAADDAGIVLDVTMTTNHLGPFLLTHLLFGLLHSSVPSRIINVSSLAQRMVKGSFDFEALRGEKPMSPFTAYAHSKLANLMFTRGLGDKLESTGVSAYCVHPGVVSTEIRRNLSWFQDIFIRIFFFFIMSKPQEGAETLIYLCLAHADELASGKYYVDCRLAEDKVNPLANDNTVVAKLWEESAHLVGLGKEESQLESENSALPGVH